MPKLYTKALLFFLICFTSVSTGFCQSLLNQKLLSIKAVSDSARINIPITQAFVQTDKPYYASGDTLWFKAYLLNADLNRTAQSGIIYVDIANDSSKVIKQMMLPLANGITWGNINLNQKDFAPGTYTIRAYTNWMRNFGNKAFFYTTVYITGSAEKNWLVNINPHHKDSLNKIIFQLTGFDKVPMH